MRKLSRRCRWKNSAGEVEIRERRCQVGSGDVSIVLRHSVVERLHQPKDLRFHHVLFDVAPQSHHSRHFCPRHAVGGLLSLWCTQRSHSCAIPGLSTAALRFRRLRKQAHMRCGSPKAGSVIECNLRVEKLASRTAAHTLGHTTR